MINKRVALLVGNGTRVPAMLECAKNLKGIEIVLILSCVGEGTGTQTARKYSVDTEVIRWDEYKKLPEGKYVFEAEVLQSLQNHKVDFVVMAGWRVIMKQRFLEIYKDYAINIHPSLLPKYPGNGEKAIESQWKNRHEDRSAGCTLHRVDEGMDTGRPLLQYRLDPRECTSREDLAEKIYQKENWLLCEGLELIAEGKV